MYNLFRLSAYTAPLHHVEMPFGRHKGETLQDLVDNHPDYVEWFIGASTSRFADLYRDDLHDALAKRRRTLIEKAEPLTLTEHQQDAVDKVTDVLLDKGSVARLDGGAGVGKSYTTRGIAREMIGQGYRVRACAVSYVASEILKPGLDSIGVPVATVARTLGLQKVFEDGVESYSPSPRTDELLPKILGRRNLLIVDEYSMVNDSTAELLADAARRHGGVLLFVGDQAQLPPVKQDTPSVVGQPWVHDGIAALTRSMRFEEGSPLHGIEQLVRGYPGTLFHARIENSDSVEVVRDHTRLLEAYLRNYRAEPDALHRLLAFTQREVLASNNAVRAVLHGPHAPPVVEDERLMIMSTTDTPFSDDDTVSTTRYYSGQNFAVETIEKDVYEISVDGVDYMIPHYRVKFPNRSEFVRIVFATSETRVDESKLGSFEYAAALNAARRYGLAEDDTGRRTGSWIPFKRLKGDFVWVGYQYCTTVHRCQGQTVDYAYTDPRRLTSIGGIMGRALTYVAMTRASGKLTFLL